MFFSEMQADMRINDPNPGEIPHSFGRSIPVPKLLAECQSSDAWRFFPHHFVGELWWLRCVSVSRFPSFLYWVGCKVALVNCIVSRYLYILHVSRSMLLAICAWVRASTCFLHNLKITDETNLIHLEIVSLPRLPLAQHPSKPGVVSSGVWNSYHVKFKAHIYPYTSKDIFSSIARTYLHI